MVIEWLARRLPELVEAHGVVGAQVAVLADEERGYTALHEDALISAEPVGGRHPVIVLCGRGELGFVRWLHHGRAEVRI